MRRGALRGNFTLLLLLSQVARIGLDASLLVTLVVFGLCVGIHYGFFPIPESIQSLSDVCLSPVMILSGGIQLKRIFLAHFFHVHDMHIYYNMSSWLWKGRQLERALGSVRFGVLVAVLGVVSSGLYVLFGRILSTLTEDASYMQQCAVGLSAILFALKVVLFYNSPGQSSVLGLFTVPSKYAYWVELILIQFFDPTASWVGHAAGISAGLLFVKGFLAPVVDALCGMVDSVVQDDGRVERQGRWNNDEDWQQEPVYRAPAHGMSPDEMERIRQARLRAANDPNRWYNR